MCQLTIQLSNNNCDGLYLLLTQVAIAYNHNNKKTREMCSHIDMQIHDVSHFPFRADPRLELALGFDFWPFDLRVSACLGPAMHYMSTDFGADSSSRFPLWPRTDRQTDPTPAAIQLAWVTGNKLPSRTLVLHPQTHFFKGVVLNLILVMFKSQLTAVFNCIYFRLELQKSFRTEHFA